MPSPWLTHVAATPRFVNGQVMENYDDKLANAGSIMGSVVNGESSPSDITKKKQWKPLFKNKKHKKNNKSTDI
jgi:hypothetical protein